MACEPYRTWIEAQLKQRRNAMSIYQDLVDQHRFAGAYNSVKRFVRQLRNREPEQFDRPSFLPGEEMQVDYGEGGLTRLPGKDIYRRPRLFVATLRYSRRSFRRVVWKSSHQIWAELHEQAWRYFGGSCRYVVLDNLKEGVIKPDLYEPQQRIFDGFQDWPVRSTKSDSPPLRPGGGGACARRVRPNDCLTNLR